MPDERGLAAVVEAILRPLRFASKDGFARMDSVKGLGPLVEGLCLKAAAFDPRATVFKRIGADFSGFDELDVAVRRARIAAALEALSPFQSPDDQPSAPGHSPAAMPDLPPPRRAPRLTADEVKARQKALAAPVAALKGVGPKLGALMDKRGLKTIEDLLYHLPIRYEDRSRIRKIRELTPGESETVIAELLALGEVRYGRRRVFEMAVGDGSSILKLKFFNYRAQYMGRYRPGQRLLVFGLVSRYGHQLEMIHPDIEIDGEAGAPDAGEGPNGPDGRAAVTPVYSQLENFHQKTIRKIVGGAASTHAAMAAGGVPPDVLSRRSLPCLADALAELHSPSSIEAAERARKAVAFDELFVLELGLALKRKRVKGERGLKLDKPGPLAAALENALPFRLTAAQERVVAEITKDLSSGYPMNRLVQGDVGSGKTVVSLIACLAAVEAGRQAAVMAPTEILAEQHYLNIRAYGERLGFSTVLLSGALTKAERKKAVEAAASGGADIVIGTHSLIQKDVAFRDLAVAVVDEQHRFGVVQRALLRAKRADGLAPHVLIMTATPIPRTLSMTVFGDLDVSVMDELPPGRSPVLTRVYWEKDRARAYEEIRKELAGGRQGYVVYPLVEESEELPLKDATNMKEKLEREIFRDFRVGLLHGRMKSDEKESVMRAFKEHRVDLLVSTTVIEVGVDVPNAAVILIEHAERFGLSQLHQLRGRVGRGAHRSTCILLARWTSTEDSYRRLKVLERTGDGFKIAEEDLKIRGPGDFLGTRQSGLPDFRLSWALGDLTLLKHAREDALGLLASDPDLAGPDGAPVREVLKARWAGRLELAEIG